MAFLAHELHDALRFLGITAAEFPEIRREIEQLRDIVGRPPGVPTRVIPPK